MAGMSEEIQAILADEEKVKAVCEAVFKEFDKNGDGTIDKSELKEAVQKFNSQAAEAADVTDAQIDDALKELDKNDDGKLDQDEFQVLVVEILKSLA